MKLQIVDAPPKLQVTPRADFSAVAGESDRQQIILANVGGGLIEGRVAPKEPFHVEGADRFSLGRGAMTNIVIRFSPTQVESVAPQKLAPAPADPGATITLRGEVSAPFEASAEPLKVEATGARSGLILISNLASTPLAVDIELTPKDAAEVSSREEIPPQSTAQIPVTISSEKAGGAFKLGVALSSPFHRQDLTFEVPAVPPRLELVTPGLDFRESNEADLIVKNSGGTEGRFDLGLPPDVKSLSKTQTFTVAARTNTSVKLRWERSGEECEDNAMVKAAGLSRNLDVLRPARLKVVTDKLDFRKSAEAELVVTNSGDAVGRFVLVLPPGLEAGDQSQKWEVPARGEIRVQLRQISPDTQTEGRPVSVNLGVDGTTVVPVVVAEVPPGRPWQINKDVQLEISNEKVRIKWLLEKPGWSDAVLERVGGAGNQPYDPRPEEAGWLESWITGLKVFLGKRIEVPGEEQEIPTATESAWQSMRIAPDDLGAAGTVLRITAQAANSGEREPVSEEFVLDVEKKLLLPAAATPISSCGTPEEHALVLSRQYEGRDLALTIGLFGKDQSPKFVVEQITGISSKADRIPGSAPCYATKELPSSMASVLKQVGTAKSGAIVMQTVTVLFKNLPRGQTFLVRLMRVERDLKLTPTTPFEISGPPPLAMPWNLLFVMGAATFVLWAVWRRRRGSQN
ncbi:MAG: hypothetical protein ACKOKC_06730 [Chthoniobacterales bacterium]